MGAEPYTEETRRRIEALFDMKVYNSYGLSEMNGPGVAFECQYQNGLHLWEDAYLLEIIDPNTGKLVPDGEVGDWCSRPCAATGCPSCATGPAISPGSSPATVPAAASTAASTASLAAPTT